MCMNKPKQAKPQLQLLAPPDRQQTEREVSLASLMRKSRKGAAAHILTSPVGIPASPKLVG